MAEADLPTRLVERTRRVHWFDLTDLALFWIVGSIIIKATYKGRMQAEAKAAVATENAEAESLKRQVMEARMAAMQAQVEPHFLFNTLASIDHLIQTDPARASQMQKNLIALLRASMPTLREAGAGGVRDLGRELAVVRPVPGDPEGAHGRAPGDADRRARRPAVGRVSAADVAGPGGKRHQARPGAEGRRRHTAAARARSCMATLRSAWPTPAWASARRPLPAPASGWPTSANAWRCCTAAAAASTVGDNPGGGTLCDHHRALPQHRLDNRLITA